MTGDRSNTSLKQATTLDLNTRFRVVSRSSVNGNNLERNYQFRLNTRSSIDLQLTNLQANADVQLLNRNGRVIRQSQLNGIRDENINVTLNEGLYYVRVHPRSQTLSTRYALKMSANPDRAGNNLSAARAFSVNDTTRLFRDYVGLSDSTDFYKFTLNRRRDVSLNLEGFQAGANLILRDGDGAVVSRAVNNGTNIGELTRTLEAGTYYIQVARRGTNNTRYALSVSAAQPEGTSIYDGSYIPQLFAASGQNLAFGQFPLPPSPILPPAFTSDEAQFASQTLGTNSVTLDTSTIIQASGREKEGYAGYSNHTFNPVSNSLQPVSNSFPTLDRTAGFYLSFQAALNAESSNPNRAGFSVLVVSSDGQNGIELGFKSDRIFAQSDSFTEAETAAPTRFSLSDTVNYELAVIGDRYRLFANNSPILSGSLRQYNFNPAQSDPPLPDSFNPYTTSNFLFFGDNTDQGSANVTLGPISVY